MDKQRRNAVKFSVILNYVLMIFSSSNIRSHSNVHLKAKMILPFEYINTHQDQTNPNR